MDHIRLIIAFLLSSIALGAFAYPREYTYQNLTPFFNSKVYTTTKTEANFSQVCADNAIEMDAKLPKQVNNILYGVSSGHQLRSYTSTPYCLYFYTNFNTNFPGSPVGTTNSQHAFVAKSCPTGFTTTPTACVCPAPKLEFKEGDQWYCENPCPPAGTKEGDSSNSVGNTGSIPPSSVCIGNCEWKGSGSVPSICADGTCYTFGPFVSTGKQCSGNGSTGSAPPAPPKEPEETQCIKKGKCPGTVNGVIVCVPCNKKSTASTSSGSESNTDTPAPSASGASGPTTSSGSSNGTSQTNCENGRCTTTTTTTTQNPDGSVSEKTEQKEQSEDSFCDENPESPICIKSSFDGTCQTAFVCDGDAVQCAQAESSWRSACSMQVEHNNPLMLEGSNAVNNPPAEPSFFESPFAFNLSSYTDGSYGPTGSCVDDFTFTFGGQSLTVPFSDYCDYLNAMGLAGNAITMIIAIGIVFGQRKS